MRLSYTQVEEAIPRFELDQDKGVQIEQWGTGAWSVYVEGKRWGEPQPARSYAEELAQAAWVRRYAAALAARLAARRSEEWAVEPAEPYVLTAVLYTGIARLKLSFSYEAAGKVTVTGLFPEGFGHQVWGANIDPGRGLDMVARETERRVLAAGYVDELLVVRAKVRAHEQRQARRAALMARAAALFGTDVQDPGDGDRLFLGDWLTGSGYVEPYGGVHDDKLTFQLSGIDGETALAMLAILAKAGKVPVTL